VDPFAALLLVAFVIFAAVVLLIGFYYPGSGLEQIGLRTAREITETREELDALDLDQMMVARNARRAARGEAELSAEDYERQVLQDVAEQQQRRERYLADRELDQLLEATNARRRKRGLPERTREQAQEELGGRSSPEPPPES
jgi:hydroxymethylpyrimidine pyrophosphatase-like HAD family hydrolase